MENELEFKDLMPLMTLQTKSEVLKESTSNEQIKKQLEQISHQSFVRPFQPQK